MAKKGDTAGIVEETGKWNTAKTYSEMMIMQPLYLCKQYREICYFGTSEIIEEFIITEQNKTQGRLYGLERYVVTLMSLITDAVGQVKSPSKMTLKNFQIALGILKNSMHLTKETTTRENYNGRFEKIEIREDIFNYILQKLININEDVSEILTQNDLIFYNIPEFDMDKAKEEFMGRISNEG
jgi:hypothetical protein